MESFREMTNHCIRIGLRDDVSTLKRLSLLTYNELRGYEVPSCYKLSAISRAAGILSSRKKSARRGRITKDPFVSRHVLVSCYGFKIVNDHLVIPAGKRVKEFIRLNAHTLEVLSDPALTVRSFSLTEGSLSLSISKEVHGMKAEDLTNAVGVDRNLKNVTVGNAKQVTYYDLSKVVEITENTRSVLKSLRRNDARINKRVSLKYGKRRVERVRQILHRVSKDIVQNAKVKRQVIVFEEIEGIRRLYRKGNGQGRQFRGKMNAWQFDDLRQMVEYKAAWEGVPVITLTTGQTRGTTMDCPKCGERLQSAFPSDSEHYRQLWCDVCREWRDRDLVAVLNISRRGWVRFAQSKGGAGEAVKGNPEHEGESVILRVDASKPGSRTRPMT